MNEEDNSNGVAGLCIPWKARFSDLAQRGSHSLLDRLRFTPGLSEISVLAGNCVGLGWQSVQSPSSVLCVYSSFPALLFISFCPIQTLLHSDSNPKTVH